MHNKLQTRLLLNSTLENIGNHKLKPTPDNYRLWYEYAAGSIEALNADIDKMITCQQRIDQVICRQLFLRHIANTDQRDVDDTRIAIGNALNAMAEQLKNWNNSSDHFCQTLDRCIEKLDGNPSMAEVKEIATTISREAVSVRDFNINMKDSLHHLTDELSSLREDVDRLGSEAITDALTQITNRRGFDIAIEEETDRATQGGTECAMIVVDIDDFKRVNDEFGHQVGDKILRFVVSTMSKSIRGNDILARYGGEEFAVILPDTPFEGAMQVAENLRRNVSSRQLTTGTDGKIIGRMTVSIGVGVYQAGESNAAFFERVDHMMYQAKRQGKDQVVGDSGG